jgi:hypothetical protein
LEDLGKDVVSVLQYLLPGFLAAWVFYAFTSFTKPPQFERIVQALIFTLITQLVVDIEKAVAVVLGSLVPLGNWTAQSQLFCSTITAFLLGIVFAYFSNNDKFHGLARKLAITRQTSYPSEWFGALLNNVTYVVLHFEDERRLYGWPIEWPSQPDKGHFVLVQASWLDGDKETPMTGVASVVVNVKDVKWIEFMEKTWEQNNGQEKS